jgi:hypothetical protein
MTVTETSAFNPMHQYHHPSICGHVSKEQLSLSGYRVVLIPGVFETSTHCLNWDKDRGLDIFGSFGTLSCQRNSRVDASEIRSIGKCVRLRREGSCMHRRTPYDSASPRTTAADPTSAPATIGAVGPIRAGRLARRSERSDVEASAAPGAVSSVTGRIP